MLVVALFAASRLPGQTPTGNPTLSQQAQIQQSLAQAATLENQGQSGEAAQLYQQPFPAIRKNPDFQLDHRTKLPCLLDAGNENHDESFQRQKV